MSGSENLVRKEDARETLGASELLALQRVAEVARALTKSSGAAIAWGDSRQMFCVASSGASAPPIGTLIDPASGLARESIRYGEVAWCVDSSLDLRVSHEACEALGIASLLYLPIFDKEENVVGLLGVFSDTPSHYSRSDIEALTRLSHSPHNLLLDGDFEALASPNTEENVAIVAPFAVVQVSKSEVHDTQIDQPILSVVGPKFGSSSSRLRIPLLTVAAAGLVVATAGWISYKDSNGVQAKSTPAVIAIPSAVIPTPTPKASVNNELKLTVVIDPGHGGRDVGTTSPTGLLEKDLTLDIAQRLGTLLKKRLGCEVEFTRVDDRYVALETRAAVANDARADFLISIHGNASSHEDVRGVETYYFQSSGEALAANENTPISTPVSPDTAEAARSFAADVQAALLRGLKDGKQMLRDRGVKPASFVVLRDVQMPAVLAEVSFMSSSRDAERLDSAEYREKVAEALYSGIAHHISRRKASNAIADLNQKHPLNRQ